jgi:hypothetical protein
MPRVLRLLMIGLALCSMAHVGSPDTFFTGSAGPYPVRVSLRLPGVVPGLAQVTVRVPKDAGAINRVTVQAIQWNLGPEGAPPPDRASPVPGDAELYAADLWLMVPTSYRLVVVVDGASGNGTAIVPIMALATTERPMPRGMGLLLSALGVFLAAGLLTILTVAVRESVVPPGEVADDRLRRRGHIAAAIGIVVLAVAIFGGRAWWNAEALAYAESVIYRPFASEAAVTTSEGGVRKLSLTIRDRRWPASNPGSRYNALIPDHGKLMHMFVIRDGDLGAFAHVHPVPRSAKDEVFDVELPPLPSGTYRVYGDIVHESGYAQTLVASVTLDDTHGAVSSADSDDSWFDGPAVAESTTASYRAADDLTIAWQRGDPLTAGAERLLTFVATNADGTPATLEPYMGMIGHAAVANADGTVFAHLHPSGSIAMAALQKFEAGSADRHAQHRGMSGNQLSIPYAFPRAGKYRLWVQMKRGGRVVTAAFDLEVRPASTSS